jgi:hypothetical protein
VVAGTIGPPLPPRRDLSDKSGLLRLTTIVGHELDPTNSHAVLSEALANGYIRDPIRLPPGALQCHWHLELTPVGVEEVLRFLRQQGKTADELLADARVISDRVNPKPALA